MNGIKGRRAMFIAHALSDLRKAFEYNCMAHDYRDYINDNWMDEDVSFEVRQRNKYYFLKEKFLKKAISKIKTFKLPIKYGTNKGVTYFEYDGRQVSFHTFSKMDEVGGKKYRGEWTGIINTSFPFDF